MVVVDTCMSPHASSAIAGQQDGAPLSPFELLFALERGRVAERLGERAEARDSYAFVAASWTRGDPEVQPAVAAARAGLRRVGGR